MVKDMASELDFDKKVYIRNCRKEETVTVKVVPLLLQQPQGHEKLPQSQSKMERLLSKGVKAGSTSVTVTDKDKKAGTISVTVK